MSYFLIATFFAVDTFSSRGHELIRIALAVVGNITGEGTVNYIARFAGGANPSNVIGDSIIYDDGAGRVGIGTTNPGAKLQIVDSGNVNHLRLSYDEIGTADWNIKRDLNSGAFSIQGTQVGNNNIWLAPTSGNVGIGRVQAKN